MRLHIYEEFLNLKCQSYDKMCRIQVSFILMVIIERLKTTRKYVLIGFKGITTNTNHNIYTGDFQSRSYKLMSPSNNMNYLHI